MDLCKLYSGEYEVDNTIKLKKLKDKLTTEFFEDRLDYGSKIIEITGKVFEISYDSKSFDIRLLKSFQVIDDKFHSYRNSKNWINDEKIVEPCSQSKKAM